MPSYAITGASRGIGWAFLCNLSSNSENTVIGIVRNKSATEKRVSEELPGRSNVFIVEGDLVDYASLQSASTATSNITGGRLDYLIANAGLVSQFDSYDAIGVLGQQHEAFEQNLLDCFKINVVGNIHLFNLFTPLILKGDAKKVIALSTGHADLDLISKYNVEACSAYAISKTGLNAAVTKFSAQYAKEGVLFLSICPGMVQTGHFDHVTEEQQKGLMKMFASFKEYSPNMKGFATPEEAAREVLSVAHKASVENGDGGAFLSHFGNKQWI